MVEISDEFNYYDTFPVLSLFLSPCLKISKNRFIPDVDIIVCLIVLFCRTKLLFVSAENYITKIISFRD